MAIKPSYLGDQTDFLPMDEKARGKNLVISLIGRMVTVLIQSIRVSGYRHYYIKKSTFRIMSKKTFQDEYRAFLKNIRWIMTSRYVWG